MSHHQAATSLVVGLAILAAAPVVWWATNPAPAGQTVTTVNAAEAMALAHDAGSSPPMPSGASGGTGGTATQQSPTTSATPELPSQSPSPAPAPARTTEPATPAPAPAPAGTPVRVQVPALGVDSSIIPVGVDDNGQLDIPEDVQTVGWYRFGPAPGSAQGSAVLTGHVDDHLQGGGALAELGSMQPGDTVTVTDDTGTARTFSVLSREEWHKGEVPLDRLFDRAGDPRLVLITCGGPFNASTLGYDDNIAVTAVPTGG